MREIAIIRPKCRRSMRKQSRRVLGKKKARKGRGLRKIGITSKNHDDGVSRGKEIKPRMGSGLGPQKKGLDKKKILTQAKLFGACQPCRDTMDEGTVKRTRTEGGERAKEGDVLKKRGNQVRKTRRNTKGGKDGTLPQQKGGMPKKKKQGGLKGKKEIRFKCGVSSVIKKDGLQRGGRGQKW